MPWNWVDAATKALQRAYRDLEKAKKKTDAAKKAWEAAVAKVFGLKGDIKASLAADAAEDAYHKAEAEEREARRKYDEALAGQVKAALAAGLDR